MEAVYHKPQPSEKRVLKMKCILLAAATAHQEGGNVGLDVFIEKTNGIIPSAQVST
ncbi:hypothetical protein KIN20_024449 [Parelaphostrongylus tenuis]|uniref:Uncharacterized protein n=1 Tax=Parelaphostrongylus tenuis TaxID=148309 RepID=A0AAD5QTN3_PARTN|nr:hypothetical protein KIN20_024449 [Parelaphostrongylus tenuis]